MAFDRKLRGVLKAVLLPTPTSITVSCGISLKVDTTFEQLIETLGREDLSGVYFYDIVDMGKKEFKRIVWEN